MTNLIVWLRGKKTYIVAGLGYVTLILGVLGVIENDVMVTMLGALGMTGLLTIRDAIGWKKQ